MTQSHSVSHGLAVALQQVLQCAARQLAEPTEILEVSKALAVARQGLRLADPQCAWANVLRGHCAQMRRQLKPIERSLALRSAVQLESLPAYFGSGAASVYRAVDREVVAAMAEFDQWQRGQAGRECRQGMRRAIKKGLKAGDIAYDVRCLEVRLHQLQQGLEGRRQALLNDTRWPTIKAMAKASRKLRQTQNFGFLLGHSSSPSEPDKVQEAFSAIKGSRRLLGWLENQLQGSLSVEQAAALGALWMQATEQASQAERELFCFASMASAAGSDAQASKARSELPLRLVFGR